MKTNNIIRKQIEKIFLAAAGFLSFFGCEETKKSMDMPPALDLTLMDTLVEPQDDFYNFVNGNWMKTAIIPDDKSRWGSFDELRDKNDSVTLVVLNDAIKRGLEEGSDRKKAADLFSSIMDTVARNKLGLGPIRPYLAQIDAIQDRKDVEKLNIAWASLGGLFFNIYASPDLKKSNINAPYFGAATLGMGRDYYQKDDNASKEKLTEYQAHISDMLKNLGNAENSDDDAERIVAFEKRMANSMLTILEMRDARNFYNKYAVSDLNQLIPDYNFETYFRETEIDIDTVIVSELKFFKELGKIIKETPIETVKAYAKWNLLNSTASWLTTSLEKQKFEFYGKKLRGTKEMRPLEERALSVVNGTIGEAVGQLYVDKVFPPKAKDSAKAMISYLRKAFKKHIEELSWMSDETKKRALGKLSKFTVKIGYPDKWEDYSSMEVKSPEDGGGYFSNMVAAIKWRYEDNISEIGKEVDKTKWGMPPQTVNAYYNPLHNEIVFPAAILQPPFFNFKADAAVNFGGIGTVIGHEFSHGFDDSGARFDGDGNLKNWWTEEDAQKFAEAGKALEEQYSTYEPVPGTFVNGKFTLGENIGDLGGVNVSLTALKMYLKDNGAQGKIDGFTPAQRFFISWGTMWRTKQTDESVKNQVKTDPHSPGYFRAIGPVVNIDEFHKAFGTKEGDKMYKAKEERIKIW